MNDSTHNQNSVMVFKVKNIRYGIYLNQVVNCLENTPLINIQGAPAYIKGMVSLKGIYIPVIDLQEKLGVSTENQAENSSILIYKFQNGSREMLAGLMIDEVSGVYKCSSKQLIDFPQSSLFPMSFFIKSILKIEQSMVMMIDTHFLFDNIKFEKDKVVFEERKNTLFFEKCHIMSESHTNPEGALSEQGIKPIISSTGQTIVSKRKIPAKRNDRPACRDTYSTGQYDFLINKLPRDFYKN